MLMRFILVLAVASLASACSDAYGQTPLLIFRCANTYTNNHEEAIRKGCTPLGASKKLSPTEKERYNACRLDAAKAPTTAGVDAGLVVCKEKFEQ